MVFSLNSFGFSLAHDHVQTLRALYSHRVVPLLLPFRGFGDTAPLSTADLDQLVKEDLVVLVDSYIFLVGQELLCFGSILTVLLNLIGNLLGLCYCFVSH